MGMFGPSKKEIQAMVQKQIQATEGSKSILELASMLTGESVSEDGTTTEYRNYAAQTSALYRKYNGQDDRGNWQTRTVIDTRVGFIAGEGISIQATNPDTAKWINDFLRVNKLKGSRFMAMVKAGEMEGKVLLYLASSKRRDHVVALRQLSEAEGGKGFKVTAEDVNDLTSVKVTAGGEGGKPFDPKSSIFVKLGGDPGRINETSTRAGLALSLIDNYDRGQSCMRKNNHLFARVTPFFETTSDQAGKDLMARIKALGWKIGMTFAGTAKFSLVAPSVGTMDNIKAELASLAKAISAVTGIPVHWLGHVDMMSNRSTAEELYDTISNATAQDRTIWSEALYDLICAAQGYAIDNGIGDITEIDYDFSVAIPVMSFTKLEGFVNALSKAYNDGAIGLPTYRNLLPCVDPYQEQMNDEESTESEVEELKGQIQNERNKASDALAQIGQKPRTPGQGESDD